MSEPTVFSREVVARLPLAQAVFTTLDYLWRDDFLDDFFHRHAGRSFQQGISFSHLVDLLGDALLQRQGSLAAALEHAPTTVATRQDYYGKLRRMPLTLSVALLRETAELERLIDGTGTATEVMERLRGLLQSSWRPRYRKARDRKPRPLRPRVKPSGAHTSVYRLQQKHRASQHKET